VSTAAPSVTRRKKLFIGLGIGCVGLLALAAVVVSVLLLVFARARDKARERDTTHVEHASATELVEAYQANGAAAEKRFRGYLTEITGTVDQRGNKEYVTLKGAGLISVQCFAAQGESFEDLNPIADVTLRGRVFGKLGNVLVKECRRVKTDETRE